jgi:hypothetical protein
MAAYLLIATLSVVFGCEHRDPPWEERFEFTMRDIGGVGVMNEQHASEWKPISLSGSRHSHRKRFCRCRLAATWT